MEYFLGFIGFMLRQFVFSFVFFWIGWIIIKLATVGCYPRTIDPRKPDCADYQLVSMFGLLMIVALVVLVVSIGQ